ncbi:MAG: hypothetical protein JNM36_05415 [Chitinophagales bacterium]|jgi:hypothetical protein|nr:hypothetical protein [Chitinophagales bacterium]
MANIRVEIIFSACTKYDYLEVFQEGVTDPFLDISVSEEKKLVFTLYPFKINTVLSVDDWENILNKAKSFLPKAIEDEERFQENIKS